MPLFQSCKEKGTYASNTLKKTSQRESEKDHKFKLILFDLFSSSSKLSSSYSTARVLQVVFLLPHKGLEYRACTPESNGTLTALILSTPSIPYQHLNPSHE